MVGTLAACAVLGLPFAVEPPQAAGHVLNCETAPKYYFGPFAPLKGKVLITAGVSDDGGYGFVRLFGENSSGRWSQLAQTIEPTANIMEGVGVLPNPVAGKPHLFVFTAGADNVGVGAYALDQKSMTLNQIFGVATKYQIIVRPTPQGPKVEAIWPADIILSRGAVTKKYLAKLGNPKVLKLTFVYSKKRNTYITDDVYLPVSR